MDSREFHHQIQPQPQPHHHHQYPPGMMIAQNSYPTHNNQNPNLISPNSTQQRFPFDSSNQFADGSSPAGGYNVPPEKRKRGRPRKYVLSPDDDIALGLVPAPVNDVPNIGGTLNVDSSAKKQRGRPSGSVKKQLDVLGLPGVGFTPHVIIVNTGEDIVSKLVSFSQEGPRTVCILSANGAISAVTLQQSPTSGSAVTYEGRFEIVSLSGSFCHSESDGNHIKPSGLSVSLAGSDGRVLGGSVAGALVAASPVQVIVGSFIADGKKSKSSSGPPASMLTFGSGGGGGAVPGISPPSEGPSDDSSDGSGSSPPHMIPGSYDNAAQHQQYQQPHMQNLPMHSNMGW